MQLNLLSRLSSVPTARHWVSRAYVLLVEQGCCGPGAESTVLELLTTEAVANAILHGSGEAMMEVTCVDGGVRVAVSDTSTEQPVVRRDGPGVIGGHGMALIDTLSTRWGVTAAPGAGVGKTIWFELTA